MGRLATTIAKLLTQQRTPGQGVGVGLRTAGGAPYHKDRRHAKQTIPSTQRLAKRTSALQFVAKYVLTAKAPAAILVHPSEHRLSGYLSPAQRRFPEIAPQQEITSSGLFPDCFILQHNPSPSIASAIVTEPRRRTDWGKISSGDRWGAHCRHAFSRPLAQHAA